MGFGATTRSRLVLFAGLYFAQGVPWGFATVAMGFRLTGLGLGPLDIGRVVSVALLPWTFKALLGPLVDQISFGRWGRRRPLILLAELAAAVTLLALAGVDPRDERALFLVLVFTNSLFVAVQDVASDALAIAMLPAVERGRANGVMSAGKWAGALVGGPGLAALADVVGWPATYLVATALLLIPATLVLLVREGEAPLARHLGEVIRALGRQLKVSFAQRTTVLAGCFAVLAGASVEFLYPLIIPLLQRDLALPPGRVKLLITMAGASSVVGSLLGGVLADRVGRRVAVAAGAGGLAMAHLAFAAMTPTWTTLLAYQLVSGVASGIMYAAVLALFMDLTNPRLAATHFQFFMGLINVRMMWSTFLGGTLAETTPTATMFILAAVLEVIPLALLPAIDARRAAETYRHANDEIR